MLPPYSTVQYRVEQRQGKKETRNRWRGNDGGEEGGEWRATKIRGKEQVSEQKRKKSEEGIGFECSQKRHLLEVIYRRNTQNNVN